MELSLRMSARLRLRQGAELAAIAALRPLHALMLAPDICFLTTLAIMLFRPPDLQFYSLDRIAFFILIFVITLRIFLLRQPIQILRPVTWPMLGLLLLALSELLGQRYDPSTWSLFAAKWVVPFVLYHLAGFVFGSTASLRTFELFVLLVLAYLSLIAIFFLLDAKLLIFPRYILDESLGIQVDRARGPFLQAVANGVTLNLLGLLALNSFRRGSLRGFCALLFLIAFPLAILATKTRAVWTSCAGSILILLLLTRDSRVRRACLCLALGGIIAILAVTLFGDPVGSMNDRLKERGPVEFRMEMYEVGWEMFLDKPLFGWRAEDIQREIGRRVSDFHPELFLFHNTYLEIAVEHGSVGLAFYVWVFVDLFRLGRVRAASASSAQNGFMDAEFRSLWPVLVGVYLLNASLVVMNYQFVNGLLFTIAGILASQNRRADAHPQASYILDDQVSGKEELLFT
jgi:O-antigen ligase